MTISAVRGTRWVGLAILMAALAPVPVNAVERLFVLTDSTHISQFRIDAQPTATFEKSYAAADLPDAFPAASISVGSGNLLRTSHDRRDSPAVFILDSRTNRLIAF